MRGRILYLGHHPVLAQYMRQRGVTRMRPQEVRRALAPHVPLRGLEVAHIIPKSIGGIHHPRNYALVPAALNRAWANNWTADKRAALGHRIVQEAGAFSLDKARRA